jgi:foldase protein PrsA
MATKKTTPNKKVTSSNKTLSLDKKFIFQILVIVLLGAGVFLFAKKYRGLLLAGTVNTKPVTRWELNKAMVKQYGKQVFDEIVSEKLLAAVAKRENITVNPEDLDAEVAKITEQVGGEDALNQTLEQYGMTRESLRERLNTTILQQKIADKLFGAEIEVTDEEVSAAYDQNKDLYGDKTLEDVKADLVDQLKGQKLQEKFFNWFQEEKSKAQINNYL